MSSRSQSSLAYVDTGNGTGNEERSTSHHTTSSIGNNTFNFTPQYASTSGSSGPGSMNLSGLVCNVRRTTGREPRPLVGATTTILGDKLYVFGGRVLSKSHPKLTSDLYELDLIRRHWTKVEATGDIPPPRYFHSVCTLGDNKLVCYGGMSPAPCNNSNNNNNNNNTEGSTSGTSQGQETQPGVVVMSDIHVFDVPARTWSRVAAIDSPQGRYAHCATILPSSAYFTSMNAPLSAVHHTTGNTATAGPAGGTDIGGSGGTEMVVVGGQDSSNHYIEQISVFNLRSLKWTNTSPLGKSCGAYRSVVAPLVGMDVSEIGSASVDQEAHNNDNDNNNENNNNNDYHYHERENESTGESKIKGYPMLIYSNYNFLDVKLELQVRLPDGRLIEKPMRGQTSPPGLRFPNGGVINGHFVVSGTYLTSSKQEYAIWSLDLRKLVWSRIDTGGLVFIHGSWNRGVLWSRRSAFVILGHRRRNLVEDYNSRRINFSHVCIVELEAFGLYNNPCRTSPTSDYVSHSCPSVPVSLRKKLNQMASGGGGRPFTSSASDELGRLASSLPEIADMELQAVGGERIPVNSRILSRRWGPYFIQLLRESSDSGTSDAATFRPGTSMYTSRISSVTVRPSIDRYSSGATTLVSGSGPGSGSGSGSGSGPGKSAITSTSTSSPTSSFPSLANLELPSSHSLPPTSRPRVLYLPHTYLTLQVLVHYFYTSSLPPAGSELCTPQILCSLLQLARPYQVNGLLEATVERLHQVLDGRNAAAVFNAAAMAAGGGRGTGFTGGLGGTLEALHGVHKAAESSSRSGDAAGSGAGVGTEGAVTETDGSRNSVLASSYSSDTEHGTSAASVSSSNTGFGVGSASTSSGRARSYSRGLPLRISTKLSNHSQQSITSLDTNCDRDHDDESIPTPSSVTSESTTNTSFSQSESELGTGTPPSSDHHHHKHNPNHSHPPRSSQQSQHRRNTHKHAHAHTHLRSIDRNREIWTGDLSSVIGLQKRGLRGLMEGRRLRERGGKPSSTSSTATSLAGVGGFHHQHQHQYQGQSESGS